MFERFKNTMGAISVNNGTISEQPFYTNFSSATSYSITTQMSRNDGSTPQGYVSVNYTPL